MELIHEHKYFLTAAECNAQGIMPLSLLVERIIETATEHANKLHIGYVDLAPLHIGWVLSRLSVEVDVWPAMNTDYTLRTWITDCNRLYSTRSHELLDETGGVIGRVRTVWAAINTSTRAAADLSVLNPEAFRCPDKPCPLDALRRIAQITNPDISTEYRFKFTDTDVNRHVNSVRYVEVVLDMRDLSWYDAHSISRFDIIYQHESLCGQTVTTESADERDDTGNVVATIVELKRDDKRVVAARLAWR